MLSKPFDIANPGSSRDGLDYGDFANNLEIHYAILARMAAPGLYACLAAPLGTQPFGGQLK